MQHRNGTHECLSVTITSIEPVHTSKGAKGSGGSGSCTQLKHPLVKMSSISSSKDRDHLQTMSIHHGTTSWRLGSSSKNGNCLLQFCQNHARMPFSANTAANT